MSLSAKSPCGCTLHKKTNQHSGEIIQHSDLTNVESTDKFWSKCEDCSEIQSKRFYPMSLGLMLLEK
jgi:hypothetical protein